MNTGLKDVGPVDFDVAGDDALVLRREAEVIVRALPSGAYDFIDSLSQGRPLGNAMAAALRGASDFDLAANIRQIISAGGITKVRLSSEPGPMHTQDLT